MESSHVLDSNIVQRTGDFSLRHTPEGRDNVFGLMHSFGPDTRHNSFYTYKFFLIGITLLLALFEDQASDFQAGLILALVVY